LAIKISCLPTTAPFQLVNAILGSLGLALFAAISAAVLPAMANRILFCA